MVSLSIAHFLCGILLSGASCGLAQNSRHGKPFPNKSPTEAKDGAKNDRKEIVIGNQDVVLKHEVNVCRFEPGDVDVKELQTHVEFYPCVDNGRGDYKVKQFLAPTCYQSKITKEKGEVTFKQYLDVGSKNCPNDGKSDQSCDIDLDEGSGIDFCESEKEFRTTSFSPIAEANCNWSVTASLNIESKVQSKDNKDTILCDKNHGNVSVVVALTLQVAGTKDGEIDEDLYLGVYKFKTRPKNALLSESIETVYEIILPQSNVDDIQTKSRSCFKKADHNENDWKIESNKWEVVVVVGSFFVGGFVLISFIAVTYYCYQCKKVKNKKKEAKRNTKHQGSPAC